MENLRHGVLVIGDEGIKFFVAVARFNLLTCHD
jgi:hypothetical protein